jgi:hypothetical protein
LYKVNDIVIIANGIKAIIVKIVNINLDGTFNVETEQGIILRIYREDIIEE